MQKTMRIPVKRATALLCVLCAVLLLASAAAERSIVSTDSWTPPDLSGFTDINSPELLLLKVLQEELGYTEGPLSNQTKYGEWFSGGRVAWCSELLTWCVDQVDQRYGTALMDSVFPYYGGPATGAPFFMRKGRFISDTGKMPNTYEVQWLIGSDQYLQSNEYIPYPGDYIFFYYYNRANGTDHVALVEGVSRNQDGSIQVHVIEGNNPDTVQRAVYALEDKSIYGYGTPVKRACTNLRVYNENDDVLQLQSECAALGYYTMEPRYLGVFTNKLKDAVKQLQRDADLRADGVVDMDTRAAIDMMMNTLQTTEKE